MVDDDLFDSARLLVERAKGHIREATAQTAAFFKRKPYTTVVEFDPDTRQKVHKVRLTSRLPKEIGAIVKDATSNLRDALDHAVYASARLLTGAIDPSDTGFPFARDAAGVEGELNGKRLRGIPSEIRPFLAGLHPHEAGNWFLFGLNRLRNPNTHRIIVPIITASAVTSVRLDGLITGNSTWGYSRWDPDKNEVEYMRLGEGSNLQYDLQLSFAVTFGRVEAVSGEEVFSTLNAMATEVETVVNGLESEATRIMQSRL